MADITYHEQEEQHNLDLIRNVCNDLPDYVKRFVRGVQQTTSPRTRLGYVRDIKIFFEYICEVYTEHPCDTPKDVSLDVLSSIDTFFIEDYLDYLQKYEKNGRIYTNGKSALKRKLCALSVLFNYLYKHDMLQENIFDKVDRPKLPEKAITRMDADETANFLDTVEYGTNLTDRQLKFHEKSKVRDLAIMTLMLSTGIRISECVGLDLNDVDFKNTCIRVTRKGGKEAIVYFSDEAVEPLQEYIEERKKLTPAKGSENALFLSSHHSRINVRTIQNMVKKYSQIAVPLKHITPHKLRSTYGTALYQETSDIYLVSDVLGHSDVNTTRKHYADMDDYRKRRARNTVQLREHNTVPDTKSKK